MTVIDNSFTTCMKDQTLAAGLTDLAAFYTLLDVLESKLDPDELLMIETEFAARSECVEKDELEWYVELYVADVSTCDVREMRVTGVTEEDARRAVHERMALSEEIYEIRVIGNVVDPDALTPEQKEDLMEQICEELALNRPDNVVPIRNVAEPDTLTPDQEELSTRGKP